MPTYRNLLESFKEDLAPFRRSMRAHHRPAYDRLFEHASLKAPSGDMVNSHDPERIIQFSMLVGVQHDILELREELELEDD